MDQTGLSEVSKQRLNESIAAAEEAVKNPTYEGIAAAYENLKRAMEDLSYDHVDNPFDLIAEPAAKISLKEGETQELFVLPEAVQALVTVTYESEDDKVVTYADGTITAVGEGKAVVTATVTANEDVPYTADSHGIFLRSGSNKRRTSGTCACLAEDRRRRANLYF